MNKVNHTEGQKEKFDSEYRLGQDSNLGHQAVKIKGALDHLAIGSC